LIVCLVAICAVAEAARSRASSKASTLAEAKADPSLDISKFGNFFKALSSARGGRPKSGKKGGKKKAGLDAALLAKLNVFLKFVEKFDKQAKRLRSLQRRVDRVSSKTKTLITVSRVLSTGQEAIMESLHAFDEKQRQARPERRVIVVEKPVTLTAEGTPVVPVTATAAGGRRGSGSSSRGSKRSSRGLGGNAAAPAVPYRAENAPENAPDSKDDFVNTVKRSRLRNLQRPKFPSFKKRSNKFRKFPSFKKRSNKRSNK